MLLCVWGGYGKRGIKNSVLFFVLWFFGYGREGERERRGLLFFTMFMCVDVCYESVLLLLFLLASFCAVLWSVCVCVGRFRNA